MYTRVYRRIHRVSLAALGEYGVMTLVTVTRHARYHSLSLSVSVSLSL